MFTHCSFCLKSLPVVRFHAGGKAFCNETCHSLFNQAETYVLPPFPTPKPLVAQFYDGLNIPLDKAGEGDT